MPQKDLSPLFLVASTLSKIPCHIPSEKGVHRIPWLTGFSGSRQYTTDHHFLSPHFHLFPYFWFCTEGPILKHFHEFFKSFIHYILIILISLPEPLLPIYPTQCQILHLLVTWWVPSPACVGQLLLGEFRACHGVCLVDWASHHYRELTLPLPAAVECQNFLLSWSWKVISTLLLPCWAFVWVAFSQDICMLLQSLQVLMCICSAVCVIHCFPEVIFCLYSNNISAPSSK